jgi:hypothetical protein
MMFKTVGRILGKLIVVCFKALFLHSPGQTKSRKTLCNVAAKIGNGGFDSLGIFLFDTVSRPALGPIQPAIQWVPGVLSLGVKRAGREADHSPPYSAKVKEFVELYLHSPIPLHGMMLS